MSERDQVLFGVLSVCGGYVAFCDDGCDYTTPLCLHVDNATRRLVDHRRVRHEASWNGRPLGTTVRHRERETR